MSHQHRETLTLQGWRFTTTHALAKEIVALLECSDYFLQIQITPSEFERLVYELENVRMLGRVKVTKVGE